MFNAINRYVLIPILTMAWAVAYLVDQGVRKIKRRFK